MVPHDSVTTALSCLLSSLCRFWAPEFTLKCLRKNLFNLVLCHGKVCPAEITACFTALGAVWGDLPRFALFPDCRQVRYWHKSCFRKLITNKINLLRETKLWSQKAHETPSVLNHRLSLLFAVGCSLPCQEWGKSLGLGKAVWKEGKTCLKFSCQWEVSDLVWRFGLLLLKAGYFNTEFYILGQPNSNENVWFSRWSWQLHRCVGESLT